ncbi:hypothetical protein GM418_09435 [Maribellus comscasis]|uniref:Uncharacterized protein n=1 Tax=Maribellus comscasis TaxID=2681766 RepID=A0A6I6JS13_9BACT|nr:hypothetical protein [Maribellus comscasis]QGY43870.1 hypothetical protein GM418_09435 [Maribellus comscasis]
MDDLIVIILTLIVAVVGTIGQIKKKKQPQPESGTEEQNSSDNFWDVLEDFGDKPSNPKPGETEYEPETIEEKPIVNQQYTFKAENEGKDSVLKKTSSIKNGIKQNLEEEKKENISNTFSLRKAVIYSEILNRKYT